LSAWLTSLGVAHEQGDVLERICERLRREGIVKVSFQIYWYGDQDVVDDVSAEGKDGKEVVMRTVSDDDLWDLANEAYGSQYGHWELSVEEQRLDWVGEETPPEDEEDEWDDEEDEWDDEEEEEAG
jgi:hypothetical protein